MGTVTKLLTVNFLIFLLSFSIVSTSNVSAFSGDSKIPEFVEGQLIVSFSPSLNSNKVDDFFDSMSKSYGLNKIRDLDRHVEGQYDLQEKLVKVPAGQERKFLNILKNNPNVENVGLNYIVHTMDTTPNDTDFSALWGLHNEGQTGGTFDADIDAPLAWDITQGSHTVFVGIIDTGIDYNHPDLAGNVWTNLAELNGITGVDDDDNGYVDDIHGLDTINDDSDPLDDNNHGTHVAGTIGGIGNNGNGVAGVNWNVTMVACKFLDKNGSGNTGGATECFEYFKALKDINGLNIVATNNSWGGGGFDEILSDAMGNMTGTLHLIAAGNANQDNDATPAYPANNPIPNKLVVAASDHNDKIASFSSYGATTVDLAAPGVAIKSTIVGGGYNTFSGTSMATPHVAGAAALLKSHSPSLNQDQVQNIIRCNVDPILDSKKTITNGRLNVGNMIVNDNNEPAIIYNLSIEQPNFSSIDVGFLATGDDSGLGNACYYDIRYSTSQIDESNWNDAARATSEPKPQSSGSYESVRISGLDPNTTYFIGIKAGDEAGNESPLSNVVSTTTTTGEIVFEDGMEIPSSEKWNLDGLWHTTQTRANTGNWSWHYADQSTNTYETGGQSNSGTLETQLIDLSDATEARLIFSEWSELEASTSYDRTRVGISTNGLFFTTVFESHGTGGVWEDREINLNQYAGQKIYVGFNFDTIDGVLNNFEGWYLDDIKIVKGIIDSNPTPNNPPTSVVGGPYFGTEGVSIDFDGSGSTDSDGTITSYDWNFGDGNTGTGVTPSHTYASAGTYNVTLVVTDNDNATDISMTQATADPVSNLAPTSVVGGPYFGTEGVSIDFDGSGSTDSDGTITSYDWNFGDGNTGTGVTPSHTYAVAGDYNVELTVTDNDGANDTSSILVTVDPVSNASVELINPLEGQQVSGKTKIEWSVSGFSGQTTVQIYIDDLSNLKTTIVSGKTSYIWNTSEDGIGPHIILVEVIDTSGNSASDSKNVEVLAEQKGGGNPNKGGPKNQ